VTAIVIAFAVFATAAVFAWTIFSGRVHEATPSTRNPPTSGSPAGADLSGIPEGWTELPAPPDIRSGAALVWTGSQLLIWGGSPGWCDEQSPERDGMAFDGSSKTWIAIPPAPIAGRCFPAYAWTGRELLIWGGWDGSWSEDEPGTLSDGAAYDPATNQWRVLPPSGVTARAPLFAWTGEELIVWGTSFRTGHRPLDGAAYDPVSDSWRMIAVGQIELTDAVGVWTGTEMIVFGAALHGGNFPETPTAVGAAYNPASDTWRQLPESDIDPNANTASWLEDRLIAWDYSEHTSAYSPGSDAWESLRGPPVDACEDIPSSVTAEGFIFGQLCGELVMMRPGEDRWHNVTRRDLPFWPASFAPAEDLVFVLGHESFDQGAPTKMFAFRPPSSFACGGFPGVHETELAGAVAARFELLRSDRPEMLARPEIDDLLSAAGEAAFEDPANGLGGLFASVALDRIDSVEPLPGADGFRVLVRQYDLKGDGMLSEELTLRAGTNLSGGDCSLLVDDAKTIGGGSD
jgi:Kelch motif